MMNESIPSLLRESNKQIRLLVAEAFRAKGLDEIRPQEGFFFGASIPTPIAPAPIFRPVGASLNRAFLNRFLF